MSKIFVAIMLAFMLTGCGSMIEKEPRVVVKYEYVYDFPPEELYNLPANVPDIDPEKSTQKEVANWLTQRYERTILLEEMILNLKEFSELAKKRAIEAQQKANGE